MAMVAATARKTWPARWTTAASILPPSRTSAVRRFRFILF
jgi:hypothetical protein